MCTGILSGQLLTNSNSDGMKELPSHQPPTEGFFVRMLNDALIRMPVSTVVSFFLLECGSFSATLSAASVSTPSLFLLAYVLSVPHRRAVVPKLLLGLPLTCALSQLFPSLTRVHLSQAVQVMSNITPTRITEWKKQRAERHQRKRDECRARVRERAIAAGISPPTFAKSRDRLWEWMWHSSVCLLVF
jgi:hypothetical protein